MDQDEYLVFINYRRALSKDYAPRIKEILESKLGKGTVFLDIDNILPGTKWEQQILPKLQRSQLMISLIPENWVKITEESKAGRRRIDSEKDWVRREIAFCLQHSKHILPIIYEAGIFPDKDDLPSAIQGFCDHQCHPSELRASNLEDDLIGVVKAIKDLLQINVNTPSLNSTDKIYQDFVKSKGGIFNIKIPHTRYSQISCDRSQEIKKLIDHLSKRANNAALYYFISGRFEDNIESLVERYILDLEEKNFNVNYLAKIQEDQNILNIENLPIGIDLENSKKLFLEHFNNRFKYLNLAPNIGSLSEFIATQNPVTKTDFCVFVFRINNNSRFNFFLDYMNWIINEFSNAYSKSVTFLYFFTYHQDKRVKQFKKIAFDFILPQHKKKVLSNHFGPNEKCLFLSNMSLVPCEDLKMWFNEYSNKNFEVIRIINNAKKDPMFNKFYNKRSDSFRMSIIEKIISMLIEKK